MSSARTMVLPVSHDTVSREQASPGSGQRLLRFKSDLHEKMIQNMDLSTLGKLNEAELRSEVRRAVASLSNNSPDLLTQGDRNRLVNDLVDETFGLGPLEQLLHDPSVSDILVNGPHTVFVERSGKLEQVDISFNDDRHLLQIIQRIVNRVNRRIDETTPMVDARLPDGSRVNAIIPPLALDGALLSIRRFGARPLVVSDLLFKGSAVPEMMRFLEACVKARMNLIISGGTGSGKTTLLNALSAYIPDDERVATIEDAAELKLQQRHVVRMETRPANVEGKGEVSTRDLFRNALRMRPDRIIIGECRGPEALDMLQAMNTGHEGSMTTIHSNDTREAISRLEMTVGMAGFDLPIWIIRRQIASAIQIVVQISRLTGGERKIVKVSEITGMEGDVVTMHDLFGYKQTGLDEDRRAKGYFYSTGIRPQCLEKLESAGHALPVKMFERRIYDGGDANHKCTLAVA